MARAHLLVVDDEPSILTTLQKALSLEGYAVDVAGGVKVAEEKLGERSYDIVLFDVSLPDGDGVSFLERLRAAGNDVPVVMMSGHATIDAAVRATRLGAIDFLEKPLSTDRLLLVVENTLRLVRAEAEAARSARRRATPASSSARAARWLVLARADRARRQGHRERARHRRARHRQGARRARHPPRSPRAKGPLEKINCAAVPGELIESELFGHEAGRVHRRDQAAARQVRARRAAARSSSTRSATCRSPMQAKLLRVLQEREIERVGGTRRIKVDVRVVAATNRDLIEAAQGGHVPRRPLRSPQRRAARHPAAPRRAATTSPSSRSTSCARHGDQRPPRHDRSPTTRSPSSPPTASPATCASCAT